MRNFTIVPNKILESSKISIEARYLYCVLLKYCLNSNYIYPNRCPLSKILNCTKQHIEELIKELEINTLILKDNKTAFFIYKLSFDHKEGKTTHLGKIIPFIHKKTNKRALERLQKTLSRISYP